MFVGKKFKEFRECYELISDFSDGSPERVKKYLLKRQSENNTQGGSASYELRLRQLSNANLLEPFLKIHIGNLTKPVRWGSVGEPDWDEIRNDINRHGKSAEELVWDIYYHYLRDGYCGVLTESPSEISRTKVEAESRRERPFSVFYSAMEILNVERVGDESGDIKRLVLQAAPVVVNKKEHPRCLVYELGETGNYTAQYFKYKNEGKFSHTQTSAFGDQDDSLNWEADGEEKIGSLPYIPFVEFGRYEEGPKRSMGKTASENNREHLNKKSSKDQILYYQAFQRLLAAGMNKEELEAWGANLIAFTTDPQAKIQVVEAADPAALDQDIRQLEKRNQRQMLLEHNQLADDTKQVQSSDSKKLDRRTLEQHYVRVATLVEHGVNAFFKILADFRNLDMDQIQIVLGKEFDLKDSEQEMIEDLQVWTWSAEFGEAGKEIKRQILKRRVSELSFLAEGKDEEDTIKQEILEKLENENVEIQANGLAASLARRRLSAL